MQPDQTVIQVSECWTGPSAAHTDIRADLGPDSSALLTGVMRRWLMEEDDLTREESSAMRKFTSGKWLYRNPLFDKQENMLIHCCRLLCEWTNNVKKSQRHHKHDQRIHWSIHFIISCYLVSVHTKVSRLLTNYKTIHHSQRVLSSGTDSLLTLLFCTVIYLSDSRMRISWWFVCSSSVSPVNLSLYYLKSSEKININTALWQQLYCVINCIDILNEWSQRGLFWHTASHHTYLIVEEKLSFSRPHWNARLVFSWVVFGCWKCHFSLDGGPKWREKTSSSFS